MEVNIDLSGAREALDPENYKGVVSDTIRDVTLYAEGECKTESPVATGNLQNSHSTEIEETKGTVYNSADYWLYVVYGHRSYSGNDYPQRALTTTEGQVDNIIEQNITKRGI